MLRFFRVFLWLSILLAGCSGAGIARSAAPAQTTETAPAAGDWAGDCPVTEPTWAKPPEDAAVQGAPQYGHYYVNEDRSIWASAGWPGEEIDRLSASEGGFKVGWFRPEGAPLEITGQRMDEKALPMEADIPCCYPTRFQATGLKFPTPGCWEITAKAGDRVLSFVVAIPP